MLAASSSRSRPVNGSRSPFRIPSYSQVAGIGFNLNQGGNAGLSEDAGVDSDGGPSADGAGAADGGISSALGTITIPKSLTISTSTTGTFAGNNSLRVQLMDADNKFYCYGGKLVSGAPIPINKFNSTCWNDKGKFATPTTPIKRVDVLVPGSASTDMPFSFCLTNVTVE
jgi:hypothetical protein